MFSSLNGDRFFVVISLTEYGEKMETTFVSAVCLDDKTIGLIATAPEEG